MARNTAVPAVAPIWRKKALDDVRQFIRLHRLIETHAILPSDIVQRGRGGVPGQYQDRHSMFELRAQLRRDLETVQAAWKVVVRENEIGSEQALADQLQGFVTVGDCDRVMAFAV